MGNIFFIGPYISNTCLSHIEVGTQMSILKFSCDPMSPILQYIGKRFKQKADTDEELKSQFSNT